MTITKKPSRPATTKVERDSIAEAFIQAADHRAKAEAAHPPEVAAPKEKKNKIKAEKIQTVTPDSAPVEKEKKSKEKIKDKSKDKGKKKKDKKKEPVLIRFEDSQLTQIDSNADALGLSRAAWVRMVVAKALAQS
ncbi:hypothetical protein [Telmatospirillum sp.]|uniref:hypothetical protein n=1 Tax=Telmatospirillum sp. TaxID=2079197 RepID=UPI002844CF45|nr:hypothetical protein [Telmatospirillum sp.]MDR3435193.1 hypothetical protein [Telmatospirillum sp.]